MMFLNWTSRQLKVTPRLSRPALCVPLMIIALTSLSNVCLSQTPESELAAKAELLRQPTLISANGNPFGVGQVDLPLALAVEHGWHSDRSVEVTSSDCKIWLTTSALAANAEARTVHEPDSAKLSNDVLRVLFLYHGEGLAAVEVRISGKPGLIVRSAGVGAPHAELMQRWWQALSNQQRDLSPPIRDLSEDFLSAIGKHLGMPPRPRLASPKEATSQLEQQFERTLAMLLGFESVRLAMMVDDSGAPAGSAPAIHPLPAAVNVVGQRIPNVLDSKEIESIASLVPSDCFYVRCRSINNYMWLRQFLIGWGGSLDEIVTHPTLNTDVRSRLEDQLGIDTRASLDADPFISDMAVIGSDVFFSEGAGIGVLLEAKPGAEQKLEAILQQQRLEKAKRMGAMQHSETVAKHQVSYFHTPDNRMRSFLVRHGSYLLVTNSQEILTAILSPQAVTRSLASLQEYRYALASDQLLSRAGITLYISDPFIRRLTSPAFRIELGRRRASAKDCRQLEAAAMVAESLGQESNSKKSLIANHFLPTDFGVRPDGSRVELQSDGAFDSLRGRVGTFVPVADVATTKANQHELSAYLSFSQRYRAEWAAMDPVLVSIASSAINESVERVELQIHITPYARNEYRFLTNYLSQPSVTHAAMSRNELMGVSARLRTPSRDVLAHVGVVDVTVPFRVQQGELHRTDGSTRTFVEQQSFAAVSPSGTDGLQVLSGFMKSLQNRQVNLTPATLASTGAQEVAGSNLFNLGRPPTSADLAIATGELLIRGLLDVARLTAVYEDDQWSIYGGSPQLRLEVRESLVIQNVEEPTQLLMRVAGVEQAEIAPYLNAYSFCKSRKLSAAVASWLHRWSSGLRTDPNVFRKSVEQALQGELECPLGGEFTLANNSTTWTSSKWEEDSLALVDQVPEDYHFPFLQLLKSVDLRFNLTMSSLNSDVILEVARTRDRNASPLELRPFSNQ
jgi:hypothetical protein